MPRHVVVDGSNLATEGRALPSLKQLNEAVLAFIEENPDDTVTVVVDATFGHRIDPREVPEFDAAVENNELVAPPAGAVGRGDAFVLTIANKVKATVISNDSYQEFHGEYGWLFDEGRLIGGKPVPNVGWVFVPRVPVRGPASRRATKDAKKVGKAAGHHERTTQRKAARPSKEASRPMPVPTTPPPASKHKAAAEKAAEKSPPKPAAKTDAPAASRQHHVNELLPFLGFVERHPIGSTVRGVVESYSSHGAYVALGDARGYVPLRLMADPPPRSARDTMKLASAVELVVVSFNPTRRSIDLCLPGMEPPEVRALAEAKARPAPAKRSRKKAVAEEVPPPPEARPVKRNRAKATRAAEAAVPQPAPAKRTRKKAVSAAEPKPAKRSRKKAAGS
jgi:Zc3h12a-like Ribonuclease NYN domain/S1 RNA binding domain